MDLKNGWADSISAIFDLLFLSLFQKYFDKKLFLVLSVAFVIATVVGTLSHEAGHYLVAKSVGYKPRIHYDYTSTGWNSLFDSIYTIESKYEKEIEMGSDFPAREKYNQLIRKSSRYELWIVAGGPLQTMLTGTIGLIFLFVYRNSFRRTQNLNSRQWTRVFITLFWLRQTVNLMLWLIDYLLSGEFSFRSDEIRIALELGIPFWSLTAITGAIGLAVLSIVLFKFIPVRQRLTFFAAGIAGGAAGYVLWLDLLGAVVLR